MLENSNTYDMKIKITLCLNFNIDRVGCLNTLMNSLNEVISVHFCAKTNEHRNLSRTGEK